MDSKYNVGAKNRENTGGDMTNREFSENDEMFKMICAKVGLPFAKPSHKGKPSGTHGSLTRQASKWRKGRGIAWKKRFDVL